MNNKGLSGEGHWEKNMKFSLFLLYKDTNILENNFLDK